MTQRARLEAIVLGVVASAIWAGMVAISTELTVGPIVSALGLVAWTAFRAPGWSWVLTKWRRNDILEHRRACTWGTLNGIYMMVLFDVLRSAEAFSFGLDAGAAVGSALALRYTRPKWLLGFPPTSTLDETSGLLGAELTIALRDKERRATRLRLCWVAWNLVVRGGLWNGRVAAP